MTGYQADELIQMGLAGISHPEDMVQGKQLFEKLVAGERDHCTVESRFLHKDGTMFRGELNLSVIRDNNSRPQSLVGLLMDVTDCNQNRSQKPA
jgi:PAS domain S-box-containing protein